MYAPGTLKRVELCPKPDTDGRCGCDEIDYHTTLYDARGDQEPVRTGVYLPHSCDEWVIGGPEQIRALIVDLEAALAKPDSAS